MFEGRSHEVVRDISNVKQEIISYRKIIKPERTTLRVLERRVENFLPEELELYFDDIVDAAERIWDLLDNYKEVVEALESTNESVISHQQSDVLRLLTVFTVIVLPLTMLTGVFGMNVDFPGEGTQAAFWVIVALLAGRPRWDGRLLPLEALALAVSPTRCGNDRRGARAIHSWWLTESRLTADDLREIAVGVGVLRVIPTASSLRMTKKYEIYSGRRAVSVEHSISPLQAALDYARTFGFAEEEIRRVSVDSVMWRGARFTAVLVPEQEQAA